MVWFLWLENIEEAVNDGLFDFAQAIFSASHFPIVTSFLSTHPAHNPSEHTLKGPISRKIHSFYCIHDEVEMLGEL